MATTKWAIDPTHSEIGFKVKHMMFTNVSGKFGTYDATIATEDDNFENAAIEFSADIDSINTNNADRDNHLKSGDFFDAENHPKLTFKAINFYPRFFFGLKNIGIVSNAISGMNAFTGLPYHGHFAVGIFFFQIIGVHNF